MRSYLPVESVTTKLKHQPQLKEPPRRKECIIVNNNATVRDGATRWAGAADQFNATVRDGATRWAGQPIDSMQLYVTV